jgi:hypothetical protein
MSELLAQLNADWVAVCKEEMYAIAEASQVMLMEELANRDAGNPAWTEEQRDQRRAELYLEHLTRAGLNIVRVVR